MGNLFGVKIGDKIQAEYQNFHLLLLLLHVQKKSISTTIVVDKT